MRLSSALIGFAFVGALPGIAYGQSIDIKGLRLGMTVAEVEAKVGTLPLKRFTIAGVPGKYADSSPEFHGGRLDKFVFFFDAERFSEVLDAVQEKYPALRCTNSKVGNALGAIFTQIGCSLADKGGYLGLSKFAGDINTSVLILASDRSTKELDAEQKVRRGDI